ncbi:hypothetical protein [Kitasatospora sp. NPDC056184]|uniref:hypothetical protein n=1 Tax=Kitasatospora sp. NPDC056184 TaxID=3345738 RepID=UPI0035DDEE24
MPDGPDSAGGAGHPPDPVRPAATATGWYQRPVVQFAVFPLAALALAALGVGVSLFQRGDGEHPARPEPPTAAAASPPPSGPSRTAGGSPAPATPGPAVHAFDRYLTGIADITVGDDNLLELDTMAVVPSGTPGADLRLDSGRLFHGAREKLDDQGIGIIDNADIPNCSTRTQLVEGKVDLDALPGDQSICVKTSQGRWVLLRIAARRPKSAYTFHVGFTGEPR